jgi:hypothetical protein
MGAGALMHDFVYPVGTARGLGPIDCRPPVLRCIVNEGKDRWPSQPSHMRFDLNLSNEPFRNRSLFWLGVTVAYLIVAVLGVAVVARSGTGRAETERLSAEASEQQRRIAELGAQLEEMRRAQGQAVMTVEDHAALDDARALINRKSVSWSQLLGELEHYVPGRSKLRSVAISSVEGSGGNRVATIRIEATGQDSGEIEHMLVNFDRSGGRFRAEPAAVEPVENTVEVAYALDVRYWPGIAATPPPAATTSAAGGGEDD